MRKMKTTIVTVAAVAALAAAAAGALPAIAAPAAPASRTPVVYTQGMGAKWGGPARRPHSFGLGADFGITKMTWSSWTSKGAFGHGHLVACAGAAGPCAIFRAGVRLSTVKRHNGTRYFATMILTGKHRRTQRLVMRHGAWTLVTAGYRLARAGDDRFLSATGGCGILHIKCDMEDSVTCLCRGWSRRRRNGQSRSATSHSFLSLTSGTTIGLNCCVRLAVGGCRYG